MFARLIFSSILFLNLIILASSYLQIPITQIKNGSQSIFALQIQILKSKYQIAITLDSQLQYLNPPKNSKSIISTNNLIGYLQGHSLEQNNNIEGWRRYFVQAFLFVQSKYNHIFQLDLDWMEVIHNSSSLVNGVLSLSPSIIKNRFFNQIKKNYPHITSDIFGIYFGASNKTNTIQFGGYQQKYAYPTISGQFHKIQIIDSDNHWIIPLSRLAFTKDDNGKYADYMLIQQPIGLKLSLSHNKLTVPQSIIKTLLIALQSQHITCKFQSRLQCQNMTSLDMSLHQFVFPINQDFSINISMYRLLNQCDKKFQHCKFNVEVGEDYEIGTSFFKDHYTVFNMQQKHILIGLTNKYPAEWFSSVYVIRILFVLFIVMIITACVVDSPKYIKMLRHRRDDVEGIELVSRQQLHEF